MSLWRFPAKESVVISFGQQLVLFCGFLLLAVVKHLFGLPVLLFLSCIATSVSLSLSGVLIFMPSSLFLPLFAFLVPLPPFFSPSRLPLIFFSLPVSL